MEQGPARTRDIASAVVDRVIAEVGYHCRPSLLKALKLAYPFERKDGWQYRVWLQEVKAKTGGFKPRKNKLQMDMFEENPRPLPQEGLAGGQG